MPLQKHQHDAGSGGGLPHPQTEFARLGGHRCELGWRLAPPKIFDCSVRGCGGTQSHAVSSLYRPVGGGKWPAEGWIAQSLARDQSDDDVDDVDDGDQDVGDAGYLSVFRLAVCPNVAAPSRELEFG